MKFTINILGDNGWEKKEVNVADCPFEHGEEEPEQILKFVTAYGGWFVSCKVCWADGPIGISEEDAVLLWNKRKI